MWIFSGKGIKNSYLPMTQCVIYTCSVVYSRLETLNNPPLFHGLVIR